MVIQLTTMIWEDRSSIFEINILLCEHVRAGYFPSTSTVQRTTISRTMNVRNKTVWSPHGFVRTGLSALHDST